MELTPTSLTIDNSDVETYTACRRSFHYGVVLARELAAERTALRYGRMAHKCLAAKYAEMDGQLHAFPSPDYASLVSTSFVESPPPEDDFRTLDSLLGLMRAYDENYTSEDFTVCRDDDNKPLIEIPFKLYLCTIGERQIFWSGRLDLIAERNEEIVLIDHKTTSMLGANYFNEFFISNQMLGYCWAIQKLGLPVTGYMMNALCSRKPSRTGTQFEFARQLFSVDSDAINDWQDNIIRILTGLLHDITTENFPGETRWCVGKYGKCQFFDVCSGAPKARMLILNSNLYRPHVWSPLHND